MSENQERRAKRLVEILVEMNILQKNGNTNYYGCLAKLEDWTRYFTIVLTKLETEELKLILARARRQAKCSECGKCK